MELPARNQVLIPMRTKDGDCRVGLFESTRTPGGVLMTKTVVDSDKSGGFWVKAVNLSDETVMLFKNQKVGIITDIVDCSGPLNLSPEEDGPTVIVLADAKFFTTIDMVSGYHQIEVAPEDRHKTAFVSPFGLFQYC